MLLNKIYLQLIQSQTRHRNAQGFMLVEVLVGILLTLILTGIAMQVVVMATAVKVKGDEVTDATIWIQQDLEDVKRKANGLEYVGSTYVPTLCGTQTLADGYGAALKDLTSINTGTIGSTADIPKTSSSGTRLYNLVRTATVKSIAPYNVLTVSYSVYKDSDTTHSSPISTFYAEVIPSASFFCKSSS
jgi:type II secretory pathway pseudopilin PulG